ncbi:MAG: GtrA family protein [Phyllobacteriaceae bacterium]|nr:GtrA family protein [Phyllobacteriaceae bacterium]
MKRRILPFAVAGAIGFLVDAGVLLLVSGVFGPFWGRLVSFVAAVLTTWVINRNFAFSDRTSGTGKRAEFLRYLFAMLPGAAMNGLAYALVVTLAGQSPLALTLAVAAGSIAGMGTNLAAANWLVFRSER